MLDILFFFIDRLWLLILRGELWQALYGGFIVLSSRLMR